VICNPGIKPKCRAILAISYFPPNEQYARFSKEEPSKANAFTKTETSTAPNSHHSQNASSHLGQQRRISLHVVAPEVAMRPLEGIHPKYPFENIVFQGGGAKGIISPVFTWASRNLVSPPI
jgi:hypothetical protein